MRLEGWEQTLAVTIEAARTKELLWGEHDCALWCGEWVKTCTGNDYVTPFRGTYTTEAGAARRIRAEGHDSLIDLIDAHLSRVDVPLAQRGDLAWLDQGCLGIVTGPRAAFIARDGSGLIMAPLAACPIAWKVG